MTKRIQELESYIFNELRDLRIDLAQSQARLAEISADWIKTQYELASSQAANKVLRNALETLQRNGRKQGWNDRYEVDMHAAAEALNQSTDDSKRSIFAKCGKKGKLWKPIGG